MKGHDYRQHILDVIEDMPGISSTEIVDEVMRRTGARSHDPIRDQRDHLADDGWIVQVTVPLEFDSYKRHCWFLAEGAH